MPMPSNSAMSPLALVAPQFNADSTSLRVKLPFSWATSTIFARSWERASCGAGTDGWAELEEAGKLKAVITQNIDNLHQMAGSKHVLELHGSVYRNYCMRCGKSYDFKYMKAAEGVPRCSCGGIIKPDVVLYEEGLNDRTINESVRAISQAQVLIIGGTSLAVYPAAGLIDYFSGEHLVVINKSPTPRDRYADLLIKEPIGQVFSQIKVKK